MAYQNPLIEEDESLAQNKAGLVSAPAPVQNQPMTLAQGPTATAVTRPGYTSLDEYEKMAEGPSNLPSGMEERISLEGAEDLLQKGGENIKTPFEVGWGYLENVASMIAQGEIADPIVGIAAMGELVKTGSADEAKEVMDKLYETSEKYTSPRSPAGKSIREKVGKGAERILGPPVEWYEENVASPFAEKAGEIGGPTAAGAAGAYAMMLPTLAMTVAGVKKKVGGPKRAIVGGPWKTTRGARWVADRLGVKPDFYTRYSPTFREKGVKLKAGKIIAENFQKKPRTAQAMRTGRWLERKTGIKLDLGGVTDDPVTKQFVDTLKGQDKLIGSQILAQQTRNLDILKKYLRNIRPRGKRSSIRNALENEQAYLNEVETGFKGARAEELRGLESGPGYEESGRQTRSMLRASEEAARAEATRLFEAVPDDLINASGLMKDFRDIMKPLSLSEDYKRNIPRQMRIAMANIKQNRGYVTAIDLDKIRSDLLKVYRAKTKVTGERNYAVEHRLERAIDAIDDAMENATIVGGDASHRAFQTARDYYRDTVKGVHGKGAVERAKRRSTQDGFVDDANVTGLFFKKGKDGIEAARQFKNAIGGNDGALDAIKAYIDNDMADRIVDRTTGEVSKARLKGWLNDHKYALQELGLTDEYRTMDQIQSHLDMVTELKNSFDKSIAGKILESDPGDEIETLLASKTPMKDAKVLKEIVSEDEAALRGLQRSLIDKLLEKTNVKTVKDVEKIFKDNQGVYNVIFSDEPEKVRTLVKFRRAVKRVVPEGELPANTKALGAIFQDFYPTRLDAQSMTNAFKRILMRSFPEIGGERVRAIVRQAVLDPNTAEELKQIAKQTRGKPGMAERRIRRFITQVGIAAATKEATTEPGLEER